MSISEASINPNGSFDEPMRSGKICNMAYLHNMSCGNEGFIQEMVKLYVKQVPAELTAMQGAIETGNAAAVKEIAHKLKSTVSLMGADSLTSILRNLELVSATATKEDLLHRCKELQQLNNRAMEEELLPLLQNDLPQV